MKTIILNNYYPHLTERVMLEVSDEIAVSPPSASGHPDQRWGEVKGRRFFCRLLTFPHRTAGNCMHLFTDL